MNAVPVNIEVWQAVALTGEEQVKPLGAHPKSTPAFAACEMHNSSQERKADIRWFRTDGNSTDSWYASADGPDGQERIYMVFKQTLRMELSFNE
jgi:hypothetical protein